MSKKFGKFFMAATLGALAGGVYYYLKKKDVLTDGGLDDDDEFDGFEEELDGEDASGKTETDRKYVDLDLTKASDTVAEKAEEKTEQFKEGLNAAKAEATDKIVGAVDDTAKAAGDAAAKVEEFFDDDDDNSMDAM